MDSLQQLSIVGDVSFKQFEAVFKLWQSQADTYFPRVIVVKKSRPVQEQDPTDGDSRSEIEERESIVGSGTLLIEQKLIRSCGKAGHIEDIVISEKYRGKKLGKL